ncbi:amidase, partial [Rhizobium ruizarguesonis]
MQGDATDLAAVIRHGSLSAEEAMQASLASAVLQEPLGTIAYLDAAMGFASAEARDSERRSAPDRFAARPFAGV